MNGKETRIITIIQTRRGSSRLPDKVFMPILGKPLFIRQAERVKAARLSGEVVIATTQEPEDDLVVETCRRHGLPFFRGDANDLLDRHYQTGRAFAADIAIKIPSDCPLIDPVVIDQTIGLFLADPGRFDFVSNLHPASFPDGNDVEIMPMSVLEQAWREADRPLEREHTTPFIWERPERFRIGNLTMTDGQDYSMTHRFTIDYREDYDFIRAVYEQLYHRNPFFGVKDILGLLDERPDIYEINRHFAGVNWYRNHLDELKTISADQTKEINEYDERKNAGTADHLIARS